MPCKPLDRRCSLRLNDFAVIGLLAASAVYATQAPPATSTAPAASQPAPTYRCDQPVYEFADLWAGDQVKHTFVIHNDGEAPLLITKVEPDCGCMAATNYSRRILAGQQGYIPVTLVTARGARHVRKQLAVETNDPLHRENVLVIQGKPTPRIELDPATGATWGRFDARMPSTKTVKLTNHTPGPMKLELTTAPDQAGFTATLKELDPGKTAELTVKAPAELTQGAHIGQIHLQTGLSDEPELLVPCSLFVPPLVESIQAGFSSMNGPDQEDQQLLMICYNGLGAMRIVSAVPSDPGIHVKVETKEPGRVYNLIVTIPARFKPAGDQPLELTVTTDVKQAPTVKIPIQARALMLASQPASQPTTTSQAASQPATAAER